ncbi:hypothetical protein ACQR0Y_00730 [Bradyrhizobium oligotrophicum]|uniref:hypothetical protein n=1 Tax=Bradyrhizobium TaxID=374 RepID=UPI002916466E|nr:hypothetical protein [Bradyrhizobium sp. SZCCHNR3003]
MACSPCGFLGLFDATIFEATIFDATIFDATIFEATDISSGEAIWTSCQIVSPATILKPTASAASTQKSERDLGEAISRGVQAAGEAGRG